MRGKPEMKWSTVVCPRCGNAIKKLFPARQRRSSPIQCQECGTQFWATPRGEIIADLWTRQCVKRRTSG